MQSDIHFVVGLWRSGTTMLREVLDMSAEVKSFPEHFVLLNHLAKANQFDEQAKQTILQSILANQDFLHFAKPDVDRLKSNFLSATNFEEAIRATYESCLKGEENPSILIDKNPIYSYYLPQIMELFPNSKFIWMLREPKDNCISRAKHKIQHFENYSYLASWWNHTNEVIAKQAAQYPDRFLLVHYDAMCEQPEVYTRRICDFLGVSFDAEMLNFRKNKDEKINAYLSSLEARDGKLDPAYLKQKYAMWENLQKPINTSKTKQWEKELTLSQISAVDKMSKDYYESLVGGKFDTLPKKSFVWSSLVSLSLGKLKWDIRRNVKR
jgi:hypothetical protein